MANNIPGVSLPKKVTPTHMSSKNQISNQARKPDGLDHTREQNRYKPNQPQSTDRSGDQQNEQTDPSQSADDIREKNRHKPQEEGGGEKTSQSEDGGISNFQWIIVICMLLMVDLAQIGLDFLFDIGVILNRFIDLIVGIGFAFFLQVQGQSFSDPRRLISMIATFIGEEIPDVDVLPFWTFDGLYNWYLYYTAHGGKIENIPGVKMALKVAEKIPQTRAIAKTVETGIKIKERIDKKLKDKGNESNSKTDAENIPEAKNPISTAGKPSETGIKSRSATGQENMPEIGSTPSAPILFKNNQNSNLSDVRKEFLDQEQSRNLNQNNDALDQLNNKESRSSAENRKLNRAREIMENYSISTEEKTDPVYTAAWNKAQKGIKPYGAQNRNGYRFNNILYVG